MLKNTGLEDASTKSYQTIMKLGLYLHIPFCRSKCAYCDFFSMPHAEYRMDAYSAALCRRIIESVPMAAAYEVDAIYFGGGTPSYLGADRLCRLLDTVLHHYNVSKDAEISLEANPDSLGGVPAARLLTAAGFNRLSLGVQSGNDRELLALGRPHTFAQAARAVEDARQGGFNNVSLDLIYGLPGQTLHGWLDSLDRALRLSPDHMSCYGLKLEEGTPLWRNRNTLEFPDDDLQADMYLAAVDRLRLAGFSQYEISNFARPGRESNHNLKYWTLGEYLGFGPGAHSDFGGVRFAYARDLDAYCLETGGPPLSEKYAVSLRERAEEYLMLGLRLSAGINRQTFESRYGRSFDPVENVLSGLPTYAVKTLQGAWRLTPKGFLVSNEIITRVLDSISS